MGTLNWLKELEGRVMDATSYKRLRRNFEMLEENNALLRDKVNLLEGKVDDLKKHVHKVDRENRDLKNRMSDQRRAEQYEVHDGFAFKRVQNGKFENTPYCPNCYAVLSSMGDMYECHRCKYVKESITKPHVLASLLGSSLK